MIVPGWMQACSILLHVVFCLLIRLLGKEMPLPGDLDTRIDTPKRKHSLYVIKAVFV